MGFCQPLDERVVGAEAVARMQEEQGLAFAADQEFGFGIGKAMSFGQG